MISSNDIKHGLQKGRIFANRKQWVEPYVMTGKMSGRRPQTHHQVGAVTGMDVEEGYSQRDVYGFRNAPGYEVAPHIVCSTDAAQGSGVAPGGKQREQVLETLATVPQELASVKGGDTTVHLRPSADMYTGPEEFSASFNRKVAATKRKTVELRKKMRFTNKN